jgi:flagellar motor switch protein FliG
LSEVEQAQKEVLAVAMRLAEEGTIMLASGGEEFV